MVEAVPAQVMEIVVKTGVYGELTQVMVKVLDGRDQGRILRRNVRGPIKVGDLLMLLDTETEAKPVRSK